MFAVYSYLRFFVLFMYVCRFLELGDVEATKSTKPLLKGACLKPLSFNKGFIGYCLVETLSLLLAWIFNLLICCHIFSALN